MKITQKEFREYRNKLLKQRKEILNDKRRDKMGKVINWIKKNSFNCILGTIGVLIFTAFFFMVFQVASYKAQLQVNEERVNNLLNANNSLAEKVVEFQEKEKQQVNNIRNYILRYYRTVPPIVAMEIAKNIIIASEKHKFPITPIVAVMEIESQFNAAARSHKGARGLMQVMPLWLKELNLNNKYELHDIEIGIDSGTYILKKYLSNKDYNMERALYQYVGGDSSYISRVYNSMGRFVVFKGISNNKKEVSIQLDEEQSAIEIDEEETKTFTHTVKYRGETLSLISKWYTGDVLNWKQIHKLNPKIEEYKMQIGDTITLPIELVKTTNPLMKEYVQTN